MLTVDIYQYNVMLPVLPPLRYYGQKARAKRIAEVFQNLPSADFIVLNELIPNPLFLIVVRAFRKMGYPYHTYPMTQKLTENGGIVVFSRYEITMQEYSLFGSACLNEDCLAAKGILYARATKEGQPLHLFATHLQAWVAVQSQAVREQQLQHIRLFMNSFAIPATDPVFVVGDLNMDFYKHKPHFQHLLFTLDLALPTVQGSTRFSVDPHHNILVGIDDPDKYQSKAFPRGCGKEYLATLECPCCPAEWVDFVLWSQRHQAPQTCSIEIRPIKVQPFRMPLNMTKTVTSKDVSDHFVVHGSFQFALSNRKRSPNKANRTHTDRNYTVGKNSYDQQAAIFLTLIITASLIGLSLLVWFFARAQKIQPSSFNLSKKKKKKQR